MKKGELSRLRLNVSLLSAELDEKDKEIERLKAEIELLRKTCEANSKAFVNNVWPFAKMKTLEHFCYTDAAVFSKVRSAVMHAKKKTGFDIRTKLHNGKLFVKRFN